MASYLGEFAALATAALFTISSTLLTLASRRIGSLMLNRVRLVLAVGWLLLAHALLRQPLPLDVGADRWLWLGLSGIAGLALGDAFLFQAFIYVGPRLTMLMMALAPAMAGILAWIFLGESLSTTQLLGIVIALAGIAWVVNDRNQQPGAAPEDRRQYWLGILCGLGAATGQASGLVLARPGALGIPAISATLMRLLAATLVIWLYTLLRGQAGDTVRKLTIQRPALWLAIGGSFFGPFLGVTFSIFAIQHAAIGVASTLMALTPVLLLPVGYFFFKEKFGWQAAVGTLLAMAGVALLFL